MTIRLDDPRLANEIRSLVDRRIAYAMQHLIGDVRYGTVTAVDAPNFRCSVSLGASPNASPGFAYAAHILPAVGDQVRVIIRGADRYIDEVLDGDASTLVERRASADRCTPTPRKPSPARPQCESRTGCQLVR